MPYPLPASAQARAGLSPHRSIDPRRTFTAATLLVIASIMASLVLPFQALAATFTLAPTADSYVTNATGQTGANFGTAMTLQASGGTPTNRSYLQFNVQGLSGAATSANLAVWVLSAGGGASARQLTTPGTAWTETGITWNNAPPLNLTTAVKTLGTITPGTWANFDVTSIVTGNGNLTIGLTTATSASFASREDATHPPVLTVTGPGAATVPAPPTNVSAVAGNGQATVSWTIPSSDGGSAILNYTATSSPGGISATVSGAGATSVIVPGLTPGVSYTFTVHATNGIGNSPESSPSNAVIPTAPTVPGAPTNVSAAPGNLQATVSWTIPASNGGSAILSYTAISSPGNFTNTVSGATATSVIVSGLTNGVSYTFTVHATNGIGNSIESAPSNAVIPGTTTVPGAPTNASAVPGNAQATVNWTIPVSNGGSVITGYTATSTPGNFTGFVSGASATSVTVTGLTNSTSYTFTVHATNVIGNSAESAPTNSVTPSASLPVIRRMPYLTDTTTTSTLVNFATSASSPLPTVRWDLASGNCASPPVGNSATATQVVSMSGMPAGTDIQFSTSIAGLAADTAYCYRVYQNGADLVGASTAFRTALPAGSNTPFKFAVIGDWGQGTTDQAGVATQIAAGNPNLLLTVGDNVYASGSQAEYGDLTGGNVFPSQFLPTMGRGLPIFAAQGNHGFTSNSAYIQNFPQTAVAAASGGKFLQEAYSGIPGSSNATYASTWFAFTWGRARFYVIEAAWADGNGGYTGDYQAHWNTANSGCTPTCGGELAWLQADLAANASIPLKFAFFHYPLWSDSPSEVTDTNLNGASPHLEGVLAAAGVNIVFTGHSHQYERNIVQAGGPMIVNYITGGGGAALGSVSGCHTWDAYAIAGSSHCGGTPQTLPSSFHYLLVSVNGNQVTVTPTDKTGLAFDVQTYTFGPAPPGAPTGLTPTAGNNQVALSWTAPSGTINGYNVKRATTSGGPYTTVSGPNPIPGTTYTDATATNGTTYYYVVSAVGAGGEGPNSSQVSATPATVPGAPTSPSAVGGNTQATVSWTIPVSNGGNAITGYTVTSTPGNFTGSASGPTATSAIVSGLANGTSYTFTVHATNGVGNSAESVATNAVTPATVPGPPTSPSAVAGNTNATVSWTIPVSNGGNAITGYTVTSTPGNFTGSASGPTATSAIVSGLTNGTSYTFTVHATNGVGNSAESVATNAVTPATVPGPPTSPSAVAGNTNATVSWTIPVSNGGNAITGYTATSTPGNVSATVLGASATSVLVTGLTNGTSYTFTVHATNGVGNGPESVATSAVTPNSGGATFVAVSPTRLLDTRVNNGLSGALSPYSPGTFQVTGRGGVPSNAVAVTGNLTVTAQTNAGYIFLGPDPTSSPTSSTLNFPVGDNRANGVTVALSSTGTLSATYAADAGSTDLIFDVTGYFVPNLSGATFVAVSPTRLLDTRVNNGLSGALSPYSPGTFQVTGRGGVPSNAVAVTGNLTVTAQTNAGYIFLGPDPTSSPTSSTLNFPVGDNRANGVTVALSSTGTLSATYAADAGSTDLIFDVTGYFVPNLSGATFVAVSPTRLLDTRVNNGLSGALSPYSPGTFQVTGRGGVPSNAVAVTGNLTVTAQTNAGYIFLGPDPTSSPTSSTLNFPVGDNRANGVTVALSSTGTLSATYAADAGSTDLIFDVTGYFH